MGSEMCIRDSSYIYQLSLVLATATVSLYYLSCKVARAAENLNVISVGAALYTKQKCVGLDNISVDDKWQYYPRTYVVREDLSKRFRTAAVGTKILKSGTFKSFATCKQE